MSGLNSLVHPACISSIALAAYLPETSQAPLGWPYLAFGTLTAFLPDISYLIQRLHPSHS
ncbi:MAG: hypothetical protein WBL40_18170 [Terrimicrobiaceae bacterium]